MPATIKDIARIVGVSASAVSRALNDYGDIGQQTKSRILKAARELDYHPDAIARGLVKRKTQTIGLFVLSRRDTSFGNPVSFEILAAIMDTVAGYGYDLVLFGTDAVLDQPAAYLKLCRERRVEGAILMGVRLDDVNLPTVAGSDLPFVVVDTPVRGKNVSFVGSDNVRGACVAVEHLIELGHRRIALVNGHRFAAVSHDRLAGYRLAFSRKGLPVDEDLIVEADFSQETALARATALLTSRPDVSAVFAASDLMAVGVLEAARSRELSVPEDVAVVGYDDIELASHVKPALTTVRQDRYGTGAAAVRTLIGAIRGECVRREVLLETELVVRESCGANLKRREVVGERPS